MTDFASGTNAAPRRCTHDTHAHMAQGSLLRGRRVCTASWVMEPDLRPVLCGATGTELCHIPQYEGRAMRMHAPWRSQHESHVAGAKPQGRRLTCRRAGQLLGEGFPQKPAWLPSEYWKPHADSFTTLQLSKLPAAIPASLSLPAMQPALNTGCWDSLTPKCFMLGTCPTR